MTDRLHGALERLKLMAGRSKYVIVNMKRAAHEVRTDLEGLGMDADKIGEDREATIFERVQLHHMRISWKAELQEPLREIFGGRDYEPVMAAVEKIHAEVLRGRVFVALHMHA